MEEWAMGDCQGGTFRDGRQREVHRDQHGRRQGRRPVRDALLQKRQLRTVHKGAEDLPEGGPDVVLQLQRQPVPSLPPRSRLRAAPAGEAGTVRGHLPKRGVHNDLQREGHPVRSEDHGDENQDQGRVPKRPCHEAGTGGRLEAGGAEVDGVATTSGKKITFF